jgi:phospholipid transport system transporter-binding protein
MKPDSPAVDAPALPAELTHDQAAVWVERLTAQLRGVTAGDALIDAGALSHFDSSALSVLLECRRRLQARAVGLRVRSLPPRLRALAALYGVADLLPDAH